MRYTKKPETAAIGLVLLFVVVFGGCRQGNQAIFADIEREVSTRRGNLIDNTTASGVVTAEYAGTTSYVAAVGGVFHRPRSNDQADWARIPNPAGYSSAVATAVAAAKDQTDSAAVSVYAIFVTNDAASYGLFRLESSGAWTSINVPAAAASGSRMNGLVSLDSNLDGTHDTLLLSLFDGTAQKVVVNPQRSASVVHTLAGEVGAAFPLRDAAADNFAGNASNEIQVWLVASAYGTWGFAYRLTPAVLFAASTEPLPIYRFDAGTLTINNPSGTNLNPNDETAQTRRLRAVTFAKDSKLLAFTTSEGYVLATANGTAWVASNKISPDRSFAGITYVAIGAQGLLYVGTVPGPGLGGSPAARGLFGIDVSVAGGVVTLGSSFNIPDDGGKYRSTELSTSVVRGFLNDSTGANTRLMILSGKGIWRLDYSAGSWTWSWE